MEKKIYNRTFWVDHETPVNAENLNKIEKAIYELSEQSLRPSDFIQPENSGISMNLECGNINLSLDSSVLRGNESIDHFEVIDDLVKVDPTKNNLYIFINDLMENKIEPSYKLIYKGIEYFPDIVVKSSSVICNNGQNIEEYTENQITSSVSELSEEFNTLKSELKSDVTKLEVNSDDFSSQLASIQRKLNTLSTKLEMLESQIKDLEDKNNGLIVQ